jgi:hypothetical protein
MNWSSLVNLQMVLPPVLMIATFLADVLIHKIQSVQRRPSDESKGDLQCRC